MSQYNLSDNVNDDFLFKIRENEYKMRYPLVEELEDLQSIVDETKDSVDDIKSDESKKLQDALYKFISPVNEGTPPISEFIKKQNIRVFINFNTMVKKELGIE